jgi:hypothetical protein
MKIFTRSRSRIKMMRLRNTDFPFTWHEAASNDVSTLYLYKKLYCVHYFFSRIFLYFAFRRDHENIIPELKHQVLYGDSNVSLKEEYHEILKLKTKERYTFL